MLAGLAGDAGLMLAGPGGDAGLVPGPGDGAHWSGAQKSKLIE